MAVMSLSRIRLLRNGELPRAPPALLDRNGSAAFRKSTERLWSATTVELDRILEDLPKAADGRGSNADADNRRLYICDHLRPSAAKMTSGTPS
jgi:hypothetical protein